MNGLDASGAEGSFGKPAGEAKFDFAPSNPFSSPTLSLAAMSVRIARARRRRSLPGFPSEAELRSHLSLGLRGESRKRDSDSGSWRGFWLGRWRGAVRLGKAHPLVFKSRVVEPAGKMAAQRIDNFRGHFACGYSRNINRRQILST